MNKEELLKLTKAQMLEEYGKVEVIKKNIECFNCSDCSECSYCFNCSECFNCSYCFNCFNCSECFNCSYCFNCFNCPECSYCFNCSDCSYCTSIKSHSKYRLLDVQLTEKEYKAWKAKNG